MKLKNSILLLATLTSLLASTHSMLAQQWTQTSAPSTNWTCLASSADGNNLAAGVDNGPIYFSTNSGAAWQLSDAPAQYWRGIACSADGTIMAAVTLDGQAYYSWDSGRTWVASNVPRHLGYFLSVAGSTDGSRFATGSWFDGIYISTNSGADWSITSAPNTAWYGIAMSTDGQRLVAVCNNEGPIYCSTDSGATWMPTSAPNANWTSVTCSADGLTIAAAGNDMGTGIGSIYISIDGGLNWVKSQAPDESWTSIAVSADGTRLVAGAGGVYQLSQPIYISTDSGANWSAAAAPLLPWKAVATSADGRKLAAAAYGGGIYVSQVTARDLKTQVLAEMIAAHNALPRRLPLLERAIESLQKSLAVTLWVDQMHLVLNKSQKVFAEEANATIALDLLSKHKGNPIPSNVLAGWESRLAEADRLLAHAEIERAANTVPPKRIAKAQEMLDQGDQAATKQEYLDSILLYAGAYELAAGVIGRQH